jgi:hypothetical protein
MSRELDALTASTLEYLRELASAVAAPRPDRVRLAFAAAAVAGREFVEIQSTPLFATSGRRLAE